MLLPLVTRCFPTSGGALPAQALHGYHKSRKYDATLRPSAAAQSSVLNILVNIEFTKTKAPTIASNPLIGASANVAKYQQAISNAVDLLTFQPTRLFVPTLSFHGKKQNAKLFVSILSQERLEFAVIHDCFSSKGFPTVAALLHLLRIASLYQLGYNPLFVYNFTSPPSDFSVGDAVPASIALPGTPVVCLSGKHLSRPRSALFGRLTVVLEGELSLGRNAGYNVSGKPPQRKSAAPTRRHRVCHLRTTQGAHTEFRPPCGQAALLGIDTERVPLGRSLRGASDAWANSAELMDHS
ncbi:hypothetical protein GGX14DRAFT_427094 [Mycena pura]|uniref:Uncharacterized protein n=1 Tax=Mycena pura TaxID=153505 RepID=A0AAD6YLN3_9AGAR|nr:hypothetical protein GGX14DRAFT_427094 [Mycena pura]